MATIINADTSSGLELTSDTSGQLELQSAGSTKVTVDTSGNMTVTGNVTATNVNATDITVSGDITTNKARGSFYMTTGVVTLGTSYTLMNMGGVRTGTTGEFSLSNDIVTVNKTGIYLVSYCISTDVTAGSARSESQAVLYQNGSVVDGTLVGMYNRLVDRGLSNGSWTGMLSITSGDTFGIYAQTTGPDTVQQEENSTNLTFIEL